MSHLFFKECAILLRVKIMRRERLIFRIVDDFLLELSFEEISRRYFPEMAQASGLT